jgi:hypothetical protein
LTDDRRRRLGFCGRKRIGGGSERARRGDGGDEAVPRSPRGAGAEAIPGGGADLQARARGRAVGPDAGSYWAAAARRPSREASRKEEEAKDMRRRRRRSERRSVLGVAEVGLSPAFMHSEIEIDGADVLIRDGRSEEVGP